MKSSTSSSLCVLQYLPWICQAYFVLIYFLRCIWEPPQPLPMMVRRTWISWGHMVTVLSCSALCWGSATQLLITNWTVISVILIPYIADVAVCLHNTHTQLQELKLKIKIDVMGNLNFNSANATFSILCWGDSLFTHHLKMGCSHVNLLNIFGIIIVFLAYVGCKTSLEVMKLTSFMTTFSKSLFFLQ